MPDRPAGIAADDLTRAYAYCAELTAEHGRTYNLATRLLPAPRRHAVHALYGFARHVDDIVDVTAVDDPEAAIRGVDDAHARLHAALAGDPGPLDETGLVVRALADTIRQYRIPTGYFDAFIRSMRMDVPRTPEFRPHYRTIEELREYMHGSAAVIGLELLPILDVADPAAPPAAAALGEAFQLTNFIRDMGEDLDRDRIYLPTDILAAFDVDEDLLWHCRTTGQRDVRLERALAHLIAHTRSIYRVAEPGIDLLDPKVRPAMRTAFVLYGDILRAVEESGYRVLHQRARVSRRRRLSVAAPRLASAGWTTLRSRSRLGTPTAPLLGR